MAIMCVYSIVCLTILKTILKHMVGLYVVLYVVELYKAKCDR